MFDEEIHRETGLGSLSSTFFQKLDSCRAGKVRKTSHCKGTQEHRGLPNDCSSSRSRPGFLTGWDLSDHNSSVFWEERRAAAQTPPHPHPPGCAADLTAQPRHFWMSASLRTDSSNLLNVDGLSLSALCQFQTIEK